MHLAGPLTVLLRDRLGSLVLAPGKQAGFIALIGTPGFGKGASVYYHHDRFENLKMVGEAEFPQKDSLPLEVNILPSGY